MKSLAISSSHKKIESLNHEKRSIYECACQLYDDVFLVDSRLVSYYFIRGDKKPRVIYNKKDIGNLDSLHVRGTKNRETSTAILVHTLSECGCDIFDPVERFSVGYSSKLLSTLRRFVKGIGSSSFITFNHDNAVSLLEFVDALGLFPLIGKPIAGRQGKDIELISSFENGLDYIELFFKYRDNDEVPLFLQKFEIFLSEYRALVVDGNVLGVVQKTKREGAVAANAAQGASFTKVNDQLIVDFVTKNVTGKGIVGVDIGKDEKGNLYLIEENRAPLWSIFEDATNIDVAQAIIKRSLERIS